MAAWHRRGKVGAEHEGGIWLIYGHKITFGDEEQVHYLDYGNYFTRVYTCQNVLNCIP